MENLHDVVEGMLQRSSIAFGKRLTDLLVRRTLLVRRCRGCILQCGFEREVNRSCGEEHRRVEEKVVVQLVSVQGDVESKVADAGVNRSAQSRLRLLGVSVAICAMLQDAEVLLDVGEWELIFEIVLEHSQDVQFELDGHFVQLVTHLAFEGRPLGQM